MLLIVKLFAVVIALIGVTFAVNPAIIKQYILFWKEKKRIKMAGVTVILLGMLFLIAAPRCGISWIITLLGIWSIIKGVILLTMSHKKIVSYLDWWGARPLRNMRLLGILAAVLGILLVYAV